jgi:hypothetical protein
MAMFLAIMAKEMCGWSELTARAALRGRSALVVLDTKPAISSFYRTVEICSFHVRPEEQEMMFPMLTEMLMLG